MNRFYEKVLNSRFLNGHPYISLSYACGEEWWCYKEVNKYGIIKQKSLRDLYAKFFEVDRMFTEGLMCIKNSSLFGEAYYETSVINGGYPDYAWWLHVCLKKLKKAGRYGIVVELQALNEVLEEIDYLQ